MTRVPPEMPGADRTSAAPGDGADLPRLTLARLQRQIRLARLGLAAERAVRCFWPVWSLLLLCLSALSFGLPDILPGALLWIVPLAALLALLALAGWGLWRFRWPGPDEARARLDETLPGRPIAAMADAQALGGQDPAAAAVWRAHVARMAARALGARAPKPDLRLARRDRFGLRYIALMFFALAVLFGAPARMSDLQGLPGGGTADAAVGPGWEGWIAPPPYTGRPNLYINALETDQLELPQGSRFTFRIYGAPESVRIDQDLGDPPITPKDGVKDGAAQQAGGVSTQAFVAMRSGAVRIEGRGGRVLHVVIRPDDPPAVAFAGPMEKQADGELRQPYTAHDDFAVTSGHAVISLDLDAVDRRYGLASAPELRDPIVLDLPLPISGGRANFNEALVENLSKHPWANLPVKIRFTVEDGLGQTAETPALSIPLPGRRFFDPMAAALIEMRRDLLWNRANAPEVLSVLKAVTYRPEDIFRTERAALMLRVMLRQMDKAVAAGPLSDEARDGFAETLWNAAVLVEDGGLSDALERMQRAQERLSEAMKNGASDEEIASLMEELRQATDDYIRQLAQRQQQGGDQQGGDSQQGQQITGDQLQQMMDEIQKLMREGRMAEAQALLEQFNRMMQNMRVTQGQNGQGDFPGGQAMKDLSETLRDQQGLSDDAFRDLQQQGQNQGQNQGDSQGQQGQPGGPGTGKGQQQGQSEGQSQGQSQGQAEGGSLADRQRALRNELRRQQGGLPGQSTEPGRAAREALDEAGRAMDGAEQALREGNNSEALERQADAIEQLREGMRQLDQALSDRQGRAPGAPGQMQGGQGEQRSAQGSGGQRDPLGRVIGQGGQSGTDQNMLQGEDVYRRAQDLLAEIRRRAGDQQRPELELDYLRRLLDQF